MFFLICKGSHGVSVLHGSEEKVQPKATPIICARWLNQNYSSILAICAKPINQYGNAFLCSSQMPVKFVSHSTTKSNRLKTSLSLILRKYPKMHEALQFQIKLSGKFEEALGHILCAMKELVRSSCIFNSL